MTHDQNNRINICFRELARKHERALICYVVAGFPDLKTTERIIESLVAGGADMIEIGIPFSDPIADGQVIQDASFYALDHGVTPRKAFDLVKNMRSKFPNIPILAMTYSNIVFRNGIHSFLQMGKTSGLDGLILPDLPFEESEHYVMKAREFNIEPVFLVSPNTSDSRVKSILETCSSFLYLVSVYGTTGARASFDDYTIQTVMRVKEVARSMGVPVVVGFGISTPSHARLMIGAGADGIITGSRIIEKIRENKSKRAMLSNLQSFARSMKRVCRK